MIVVSIVGILATIAVPSYQSSLIKSRETVLRQDLFTLRELLDHHRADKGEYPPSLDGLVTVDLRTLPKDPFTNSPSSWQQIIEPTEGGTFDVYSGSDLDWNKWDSI